ncbi:MAG TPA: CehA/McbA family metallohydrolase [Ktedonobacteraceae bacterium]|jgi:predicted metal-dependent phosphoesterase TrpH|nr:CehA/McbA family metallohydrolase [Ktedonobacteraceae bacterium]
MVSSLPVGQSKADLHMHTNLGDGWASPAKVVEQAISHGLQVIAVTDHDHLEGAKRVADLLERYEQPPFQMITGVEVSTRQGHLLGLFVKRAPKALRSVEESIEAIKEQGGLVLVPHPLGRLVPSLSRARIDELLNKGYPIDAIEIYNPSPANASMRAAVAQANQQWGFAETGGSDAHFWQHIGAAYTLFEGTTAEDVRLAIQNRTVRAGGQETPPAHLPAGVYVAQCAWSWFVDPPRRVMRSLKQQ